MSFYNFIRIFGTFFYLFKNICVQIIDKQFNLYQMLKTKKEFLNFQECKHVLFKYVIFWKCKKNKNKNSKNI